MDRPILSILLLASGAAAAAAHLDSDGRPLDQGVRDDAAEARETSEAPSKDPGYALSEPVIYSVGSRPKAVAIGDITGNRRADIALTTTYSGDPENDYHLFVFRGAGGGTFHEATKWPIGATANQTPVAIADLDGERGADVVVGSPQGVHRWLAEPGQVLGERVDYPGGAAAVVIATLDLGGDGVTDIAAIGWSSDGRIYHGDGQGGFVGTSPFLTTTSDYDSMAVADVDGDGLLDVVVGSGNTAYNPIMIHLQDGEGGLPLTLELPTATYRVNGIAVGDLNGNGRMDIVYSSGGNHPFSKIVVYHQETLGGFGEPVVLDSFDVPETIRVADMNGDGLDDIVVLHAGWSRIGVYLQQPDGTMGAELLFPVPFASSYGASGMSIGDINGNGCPDVAIANFSFGLLVLFGQGCPQGENVFFDGFDD